MKTKIFISILLIFTTILINAQELKQPTNIQSPNAASLGNYGDVPVSYFTGTPDISIPIHKMSVKGVNLDISLSYDASGIRVNSHPGWIGQNWTLTSGGVITRSVVGEFDEFSGFGASYLSGYLYCHEELNLIDLEDDSKLKDYYASKKVMENKDYEPDIFTFNFMGKTGKFFLGNDGEWKVISDDNLKIELKQDLVTPLFEKLPDTFYNGLVYPKVIGGFKITDDMGTEYFFGYNENAIEYSIPFFNQIYPGPAVWVANSWYLTEVKDKYGSSLYNFTYERKHFIAEFYRQIQSKRYSLSNDCGWADPTCFTPVCSYSSSLSQLYVNGNLISPVYLKEIATLFGDKIYFGISETSELKYDNNDISYTYDDLVHQYPASDYYHIYYLQQDNDYIEPLGDNYLENLKWYKLDDIRIHNSLDQYIKKIELIYNNDPNQRLNLLSIDFYGSDSHWNPEAKKLSYKLRYNQFELLPKYLSRKIDHWGFYKGSEYIINENNFSSYYSQREPDSYYLKIGLLNHIIYPTGGYTNFIYEPNEYSQIVSNDKTTLYSELGIGGGLRIKKIIDYDGEKEKIRNFKYVKNYETDKYSTNRSGVLSSKPKYYWPGFRVNIYDTGVYYAYTFSINSMIRLSNVFGAIIGYSEVVETREDGSFIIYKNSNYDNSNSFYFDESPINTLNFDASQYHPYSDLGLLRGKLLEENLYNAESNLVQKKRITYRTDHSDMKLNYVLATDAQYYNMCPNSAESVFLGNAYKIFYFDYDSEIEETSNYYDEKAVLSTVNYLREDIDLSNNNIRLTKRITKTNSEGNVIVTDFRYPLDLSSESYMQNLIDDNRIGEIIQTETTKEDQPIGAKKTTYKQDNGLIVPATVETSKTNISALETDVYYDKYDSEGNLLQFHDKSNVNTCFIWGYKNQYPIAKIENAEYIEFESSVSSIQSTSNSEMGNCFNSESCQEQILRSQLNNLRDNIPNAMITSYTYDPAIGVTSITQPNKTIEYYKYDEFNRLQKVFDYKENFVKRHEYNFIDRPYIGLSEIEYDCPSLELGSPITFYTKRIVGVGNLSWSIKSDASVLDTQSGSAESFATRLTEHGVITINCNYTDEFSYKTVSKELKINVSEVSCKFVDIQIGNPYTQQPYAEAYVQCPLEDVVRLSLLSMNTSGADFYIGDTHYRIEGYGSQMVEVPVGNQSKLKCRVEMSYDSQGYSSITVQGLENNTAQIGSPHIIEPVVRQ